MTETRICTKCLIAQPVTEFWKKPTSSSGIMPVCKTCEMARVRAWKQANRERHEAEWAEDARVAAERKP